MNGINGKKKILTVLPFVILLFSFFYHFLSPKLFDADFWWHIATGRYIVETASIPDKDPFSFTTNLEENKNLLPERENFILKQYWLGQVIFYLIYHHAGPKGIIILRALLLTMVLLLVLWRLKKWNVTFYLVLLFVFFVYLDALRYIGERPVLFTIVFTPLTFILLEEFREKQSKLVFLLPLLMLVWSNIHGGFIIGNVIIAVYMLFEGLKIILKKTTYTKNIIIAFYIVTFLAMLASYINPTGWEAFSIALSPQYKFLEEGIQEYKSPLVLYLNKLAPINYGYVILALLFPLILILRNKKIDVIHMVLLTGLFIMAAQIGRYSIYYTSLAGMVLGKETDLLLRNVFKRINERVSKKLVYAFTTLVFVSIMLFFVGFLQLRWIKLDIARGSHVPEAAIDFIEKNKLQGNMLNSHNYGGYVSWRLYPWKKTFIDTRWLNYTLQTEYGWMMNAVKSFSHNELPEGKKELWKKLLDHYSINFILIDTLDVYGNVPRLILILAEDDEWVPIYCEPIAIVFIKNVPENREIIEQFRLSREYVYNTVIGIASQMATMDRRNPRYLVSLGRTFYEMGRLRDALTAYQYAYQRFPREQGVKEMIALIESELKQEKGNERN